MFTRLKLRLTVVNVIVISLIFFLIVVGIFHLMAREISKQAEQLMQEIAADASVSNINRVLEEFKSNEFFYAKIQTGQIVAYSPELPVSREKLAVLVEEVLVVQNERGKINLDNDKNDYWFYKGIIDQENQSYLIVFLDAKQEKEILGRLFTVLATAFLSGLVLAVFGSLFMADRALIPIKQAWERQQNFIADASHELRTPLAVMQTNLELIMGNPKETVENQDKWLQNVIRENKRMAKLVDDLLLLARVDSNQELLEKKKFDLEEAILKIVESFEALVKLNELELEYMLDSQTDFIGDENRIKQLIVILLDNAVKYTKLGGKITLVMKDLGSSVEITVSDTGEGIAKEHLGKIFERFYRVEKARFRKTGSTGLGLSLAQWIVKEHGGAIKVESNPKQGTAFTVTLPKK